MRLDIGLGLIHRDAVVDVMRARSVGHHQRFRQRAAEVAGKFQPRHFGDVLDESLALRAHGYFTVAASGIKRWPNTGSFHGVGGNCQAPVAGGRTSASTCTSIKNGLLALTACSSAPLKSSDLVTVMASTPAARAQAAKSGLYGLWLGPSWNMVPSSRPPNIPN